MNMSERTTARGVGRELPTITLSVDERVLAKLTC